MFLNKGTEHICCFLKVSLRQKSFVAQFTFIFEDGGDDPGLGCRATDAVVARALPEFATRKVVNSNDRYALQVSVVTYHDHAENWMSGSFPDALGHPGSCRLIHN